MITQQPLFFFSRNHQKDNGGGFRVEIHSDASPRGRIHREDADAGKNITSTGGSAAHSWIIKQDRGQTGTFRMTFKKIAQADWEYLAG